MFLIIPICSNVPAVQYQTSIRKLHRAAQVQLHAVGSNANVPFGWPSIGPPASANLSATPPGGLATEVVGVGKEIHHI